MGLGDGRQKLGFLPEIHSDFIFANIGEELGLVATLLGRPGLFVHCGLRPVHRVSCPRPFGCLVVVGVTSLISYQAIFNICVVTSLLPEQGPGPAVHQRRRLQPAGHAHRRRLDFERGPSGRARQKIPGIAMARSFRRSLQSFCREGHMSATVSPSHSWPSPVAALAAIFSRHRCGRATASAGLRRGLAHLAQGRGSASRQIGGAVTGMELFIITLPAIGNCKPWNSH